MNQSKWIRFCGLLALAMALGIGGCSKGVEGTYTGQSPVGNVKVELKSDNTATITTPGIGGIPGMTLQSTYSVDGDKVTLKEFEKGSGNLVLTRTGDDLVGDQVTLEAEVALRQKPTELARWVSSSTLTVNRAWSA